MTTISRAARFAERTAHLRASTIREMLKVTQQPDVISFGGGLPAPELFPTAAIAEAARQVMERYGPAALQYSVTEGIPEMRRWVARAPDAAPRTSHRRRERHDRQRLAAGARSRRQGVSRSRRPRRARESIVPRRDSSVRRLSSPLSHRRHRRGRHAARIARARARARRSVSEVSLPRSELPEPDRTYALGTATRSASCASAGASVYRSSRTILTANSVSKAATCRRSSRTKPRRRSSTPARAARSWRPACGSRGSLSLTRRSARRSCSRNRAPTCTAARSRSTSSTSTLEQNARLTRTSDGSRQRTPRGATSWHGAHRVHAGGR